MIEIQEMVSNEIEEFLTRIGYGHLACARNDRPYVIPVHYAYRKPEIYIYTTEGLKTEIIRANPHVCLQVVVITGDAEQITDQSHREEAIRLIRSTNPTLTPAISIRWVNNWIRENIRVVYRLMPENVTGRSPVKVRISAAFAQPGNKSPLLIRQHKYF